MMTASPYEEAQDLKGVKTIVQTERLRDFEFFRFLREVL